MYIGIGVFSLYMIRLAGKGELASIVAIQTGGTRST